LLVATAILVITGDLPSSLIMLLRARGTTAASGRSKRCAEPPNLMAIDLADLLLTTRNLYYVLLLQEA